MTSTVPVSRRAGIALAVKIVALLLFVAASTAVSINPGPATLADSSRLLHDGLRATLTLS